MITRKQMDESAARHAESVRFSFSDITVVVDRPMGMINGVAYYRERYSPPFRGAVGLPPACAVDLESGAARGCTADELYDLLDPSFVSGLSPLPDQ